MFAVEEEDAGRVQPTHRLSPIGALSALQLAQQQVAPSEEVNSACDCECKAALSGFLITTTEALWSEALKPNGSSGAAQWPADQTAVVLHSFWVCNEERIAWMRLSRKIIMPTTGMAAAMHAHTAKSNGASREKMLIFSSDLRIRIPTE
ncbi:hypothetical protein EYF80_020130 [Liparis tanakae]|uniref:Uncharacterized protein n=1 Tax=Liparis tanakae TaxID=230148 RepID=A0A4Z2HVJ7_9TELE|nr:hypothetical protein EYF80_020130 [Liparis tanakae]